MTIPLVLRLLVTTASLAVPLAAHAKTIEVVPGPGTPIQDAIDAAAPGDKLRIRAGVYDEAIVIDKPLTIIGPPDVGPTVIDAGCAAPTAVTIAADNVRLERILIRRGSLHDVAIVQRDRVRLKQVKAHGPAAPGGCAGTQNGLLIDGGSRIQLKSSGFSGGGYTDAAIRIANLADGADVRLIKSTGHYSVRGLVLENVAAATVRVSGGGFVGNETGIMLVNADGVSIKRTTVSDSVTTGVFVDANSDENQFIRNRILSDDGVNASDNGSSNCWIDNNNGFGGLAVPTGGCP